MEEQRKPLTVQQRMTIGRRMKRLAPKMAKSRMRHAKRMASPEKMMKKAMKAAKVKLRKKVAGKKGLKYSQLSPSEKMSVDKMVMKKATPAKIKALAKKLMPKVRKKEIERVKMARGQKNESVDLDALFEQELASKTFDKVFNLDEKIEYENGKWVLYSRDGSKKLGEFDSKEDAIKREKQIQYFKHTKEEHGAGEWGTDELVKNYKKDTPGEEE